jgi:hypothetical protein
MIALGLGHYKWSTAECIRKFHAICKNGFDKKWLSKAWWRVGNFVRYMRNSIYATDTIEDVLKTSYGEDALSTLYGLRTSSRRDVPSTTVRVAVTTSVNKNLRLFANYNWGEGEVYLNSRIKVWEA